MAHGVLYHISNFGRNLHRFTDMATSRPKIATFLDFLSLNAVFARREFLICLARQKLESCDIHH